MCGSEGEIVGVIHVPSLGSEVGSLVEGEGGVSTFFFCFHARERVRLGREEDS